MNLKKERWELSTAGCQRGELPADDYAARVGVAGPDRSDDTCDVDPRTREQPPVPEGGEGETPVDSSDSSITVILPQRVVASWSRSAGDPDR